MGGFGWANGFGLILPLLEENERHGWSNPRWIMVISHGKFSLFGLITEYMNWPSIVLFLYSLKKFLVFKIKLPQYALCTIKNTHRVLVDNIGDLVFAK